MRAVKLRTLLPKPHQLVLLIGVLAALGTLASGIAPEITHWHEDSPISREVFVNIPAPLEVAFYLAVATGLFVTAWLVSLRVRNYERGKPDNRRTNKTNVHRRMRDFRARRLDAHAPARSRGRASCTRSSTSASSCCSSPRSCSRSTTSCRSR